MTTQSSSNLALNRTLSGGIVILSAATSRRRSIPARTQTRDNQRLIISPSGDVSTQNRGMETDLRIMFARLGATLSNERSRNGKFINPITKRQITVRNQTDISRLEKRMLARSRFNAAQEIQQQAQQDRLTRANNRLRSVMARHGVQNTIQRSARETNAMNDMRSHIIYVTPPPRYTQREMLEVRG